MTGGGRSRPWALAVLFPPDSCVAARTAGTLGLSGESRHLRRSHQIKQDLRDLMRIYILALVAGDPDPQLPPRHVLPHSL